MRPRPFLLALCFVLAGLQTACGEPNASVATCEEPSESIIPAEWRDEHMKPGSDYYEALFSDDARQRILRMEPVPTPPFSSGSLGLQLQALEEGRLFVDEGAPRPRIDEIDWSVDEFGRYYSTQLHAMVGMGEVLSAADPAPDDVEHAISDVLSNWGFCAAHNPDINERAWYEGTVVKRQSVFLQALNYIRRHGSIRGFDYDALLYLIDRNASYLLDSDDVYSLGNHGIRQDMLLAATALHLPEHPRAGEMLQLAQSRLEQAAERLFTNEGIWMEHAPGYVNYMSRLMLDIEKLDAYSDLFNPELFMSRLEESSTYLLRSLTPDLTIPWIGSSGAETLAAAVEKNLVARRGISIARQVQELSDDVHFYPDYGHAIVRGDHPNGLYLIFNASQNLPAGKRHADDLSFILFNHGRVWITEGGHRSYELTGMTRYLRSPFAHNTYTLGSDHVEAEASPELRTFLRTMSVANGDVEIVGFTERFPQPASVTRTIRVDRDFSSLTISDDLERRATSASKVWRGRLHLPPDLDVTLNGGQLVATDVETGKEMHVSFAGSGLAGFERYSGQEEPLRGWGTWNGELGPVTTIEYTVEGSAEIVMKFRWD